MSLERDVAFLAQVPLFQHFDEDQIKLMVFSAQRRQFPAGTMLYRQDDPAAEAYVIVAGEIDIVRQRDGGEEVLGRYGPGTALGETAMIVEIKRATSVRAVSDVEAIIVSRGVFHRLLNEYPDTARRIHASWAERLKNTMQEISEISSRFEQPQVNR